MDSAAIEAQEVCAYSKKSEEMKMAALSSKSIYQAALARTVAWGALAACAMASPLLAQNSIAGNFTLHENARFGGTVLAAGPYTFSIEPVGTIQSLRSIQQGAGHLVLVVLRPERSGSVASIFAMASRICDGVAKQPRARVKRTGSRTRKGSGAGSNHVSREGRPGGGLRLVKSKKPEPSGR